MSSACRIIVKRSGQAQPRDVLARVTAEIDRFAVVGEHDHMRVADHDLEGWCAANGLLGARGDEAPDQYLPVPVADFGPGWTAIAEDQRRRRCCRLGRRVGR